jgi:hypothetical protein
VRPVRRTQALSPFGVGAMVDFPGPVSLVHAGLDAWPFGETNMQHQEFRIDDEPRLAQHLGVRYFVTPPDYRFPRRGDEGRVPNAELKLPFVRFPLWHVCPRCGIMRQAQYHDRAAPDCVGPVATGKDKGRPHPRRRMIQVRFVAACIDGHLQDFPWWEWLFQQSAPPVAGHRLRLISSGTASLAGVGIVCETDSPEISVVKRGTLAGAFSFEAGQESPLSRIGVRCIGANPALSVPSATMPASGCGEHLYPLLRGGANVYFARVASSIYVPPIDTRVDEEVLEILEDATARNFLSMMAQAAPDGKVSKENAAVVLKVNFPQKKISADDLAAAANRRFAGAADGATPGVAGDTPDQAFRRREYDIFGSDIQHGYPKTNLLIGREPLERYEPSIRDFFSRVSLVHKLRETRAFAGFSRIFAESRLSDAELRRLLSREPRDWLPGLVVRGEGIFLQLHEDRMGRWLESMRAQHEPRIQRMHRTLNELRARRRQQPRILTPRFVLLHTLSHLLINQLVYECGYGSASLRERIYCSDGQDPMSGILIYTAAGDSEGTMGGLVRMGRPGRLEGALLRALDRAGWCSTDPVCIESGGQGPDNCNLAACHSCGLLPETSCEEQNRLLDRGMVTGSLSEPGLGFFSWRG